MQNRPNAVRRFGWYLHLDFNPFVPEWFFQRRWCHEKRLTPHDWRLHHNNGLRAGLLPTELQRADLRAYPG